MKKAYHLSTCSTCSRILKDLSAIGLHLQDIKTESVTKDQLEEMYSFTSSYEALFSKRAMKYKSMGLKEQNLLEDDFKKMILEDYTFLKRPVFIIDDEIFVGNSKKVIEAAQNKLNNE